MRSHPGANIRDMYDHIEPHLRKQPSSIVIHAGTNDAGKYAVGIIREIKSLSEWVATKTSAPVTFSMPTLRHDLPKESATI